MWIHAVMTVIGLIMMMSEPLPGEVLTLTQELAQVGVNILGAGMWAAGLWGLYRGKRCARGERYYRVKTR